MCYRTDNTMGNWFTSAVSTLTKGASVAQAAIDRTKQVLTTVQQPVPITGVNAASSPSALNLATDNPGEMPSWVLPAAAIGLGFVLFMNRRARGRRA